MAYLPFAEYWWFYLRFTAFVLVLLALDLGVFHRRAHAVSFREASLWSVVWIALAFNFVFYQYALWKFAGNPRLAGIPGFDPESAARQAGLEFLTGDAVEKTLSLDNIFVFVVVFSFFGIPAVYQHRVLFYGIIGALVFRAIFIALGSVLLQYHWVIWLFGAFLILTGVKMMFAPDRRIEPDKNPLIRLFRRLVPVTGELHGHRFFVRSKGALHALYMSGFKLADQAARMKAVIAGRPRTPSAYQVYRSRFVGR
jgi:tellurite resistance protein TerC